MENIMSEVKIVRLSTGEELICEVHSVEGAKVLKDVAILIPTQQNSLGLAPFMAYSEAKNGMTVATNFIMFMVDPVEGLLQQYKQMFKPNSIITPGEKKIII
jgi:hypothetical protein